MSTTKRAKHNTSPFFSIIIPTLNEENYLPQLLNDFAKQTFTDFDVIVVDGHSQDKTRDYARKYKKNFPLKIILCDRNVGAQRNLGATHCRGQFLLFCDADVNVPPTYLEMIKQKIERDQVDICSFRAIPNNQNWFDHFITLMANFLIWLSTKCKRPLMGGFNLLIKKSVFTAVGGFDETVIQAEDQDLATRVLKMGYNGKFYFVPSFRLSFRRFEREGRLRVILKYIYSTIYTLVKGPIRKPLFDYQMGGKV